MRAEVWGTALLHLAVSTALLAILIVYGLGTGWVAALLVAVALGFSSTVVVAKSLDEKRELRAFHGRVAIGILIVQDLVAIAVLGSRRVPRRRRGPSRCSRCCRRGASSTGFSTSPATGRSCCCSASASRSRAGTDSRRSD